MLACKPSSTTTAKTVKKTTVSKAPATKTPATKAAAATNASATSISKRRHGRIYKRVAGKNTYKPAPVARDPKTVKNERKEQTLQKRRERRQNVKEDTAPKLVLFDRVSVKDMTRECEAQLSFWTGQFERLSGKNQPNQLCTCNFYVNYKPREEIADIVMEEEFKRRVSPILNSKTPLGEITAKALANSSRPDMTPEEITWGDSFNKGVTIRLGNKHAIKIFKDGIQVSGMRTPEEMLGSAEFIRRILSHVLGQRMLMCEISTHMIFCKSFVKGVSGVAHLMVINPLHEEFGNPNGCIDELDTLRASDAAKVPDLLSDHIPEGTKVPIGFKNHFNRLHEIKKKHEKERRGAVFFAHVNGCKVCLYNSGKLRILGKTIDAILEASAFIRAILDGARNAIYLAVGLRDQDLLDGDEGDDENDGEDDEPRFDEDDEDEEMDLDGMLD